MNERDRVTNGVRRSFEHRFDATIRQIANPTANTQLSRPFSRGLPKPDALNAAGDEDMDA